MCLIAAPDKSEDPEGVGRNMLMMFNPAPTDKRFMLPTIAKPYSWRLVLDTAAASPADIFPDYNGPLLKPSAKLRLLSRSLRCYVTTG